MAVRGAGDEARLVAAVLQAFDEVGPDYEPVLDLVCRLGAELTHDPWMIRLLGDDDRIHLAGSWATDPETLADIRATMAPKAAPAEHIARAALQAGQPVLLAGDVIIATRAAAQPEVIGLMDRRGFRGGVLAPLRARGVVIGVLWWACQHRKGEHDADDLRFASTVADRVAFAIDNARLLQRLHAERNRHAAVLSQVSDAVCVVDAEGIVRDVTPGGITRVLGWDADDLLGVNIFDLVHRKDYELAMQGFVHAIGPGDVAPRVLRFRHKDGTWRHLLVSVNNLLDNPAVAGVVVTGHDVTERVLTAGLLTAENGILEGVATGAPIVDTLEAVCLMIDGRVRSASSSVWLIDEDTDELVAVAAPNVTVDLLGTPLGRISANLARNLPDAIIVHDTEVDQVWERYRDIGRDAAFGCSWARTIHDAGGRELGVLILYRSDVRQPNALEEQVIELASRLTGIAVHRARDSEQLAHAATHDTVTNLPNRRLFLERLQHAVARQRRGARPPSVLFVDLDRFKQVNDRAGHAVGDEVLRMVGARLLSVVRPTDTVARFGGDEFAVLCDETGEEEAITVAERLLVAICEPVELSGRRHHISASIGIAAGRTGVSHDALVRRADVAMYRAKSQGSGGVLAFRSGMTERTRGDLEHELRRAIDDGELMVHYQPIVDLRLGRWIGVEALARWRHPRHGWIPPTTFIALAEETGLIAPLGELVLSVATRQGAAWDAEGVEAGEMSINVSGRQLAEPRFAAAVERQLSESGFDPGRLLIELTETTMMEDFEGARASLRSLQDLGARLVIDDFGTGQSTLARLREFPAAGLKLDRTFIADLGEDKRSEDVVAAVVQLAHAVGMAVCAGGVETFEQLATVQRLDVDLAQGVLLGRPLPAEEVRALMAQPPSVSPIVALDGLPLSS